MNKRETVDFLHFGILLEDTRCKKRLTENFLKFNLTDNLAIRIIFIKHIYVVCRI